MTLTTNHFRQLLITASVIVFSCGVMGWFGSFYWFLDLFTSFVPQYALIGGILSFFLLLQGMRKPATVMLVFTIVNVYQMHLFWKRDEAVLSGLYEKVTILQFNVNKNNPRIEDITAWLVKESYGVDVITLFEVTDKWQDTIKKLSILYPYHYVHSMREDRDVAIFSKLPVKAFQSQTLRGLSVPIVLVDLETRKQHTPWLLGVVHPPPPVTAKTANTRNRVLIGAAKRMILHKRSQVSGDVFESRVLVGDLNITPWSSHFSAIIQSSELKDAQNGKGLMGTWPAILGDKLGIPIDHLLISSNIKALEREVGPSLGSDHLPVITTLGIPVMVKQGM